MADGVAQLSGGAGVNKVTAFLILLVCALLEAGGDALVRKGMHAGTMANRVGLYVFAAVVLFAYGWLVNRPPWSFGSLLGIYVVLFFVVAQWLAFTVFGERPTPALAIGGLLIVSGGIVITVLR
jgi:drug/metabolite transporter (DMT)-like permease